MKNGIIKPDNYFGKISHQQCVDLLNDLVHQRLALVEILSSKHTPDDIIDSLFFQSDSSVQSSVIRHGDLSAKFIEKIFNTKLFPNERFIAACKNTPLEILEKLFLKNDPNISKVIAKRKDISAEFLLKLCNFNDVEVIAALAENPNTPTEKLIEFSKCTNSKILSNLAQNINCPISVLEYLSCNVKDTTNFASHLLRNKNLPLKCQYILSEHRFTEVRKMVALISTNIEILFKLSNDSNEYVRRTVACNDNTPLDILIKLSNDTDDSVKDLAINRRKERLILLE